MLTELGKFLRKIRIDNGEILKNMADKLNVTASFLSAVENGKKRMPSSWNGLICRIYNFSEKQHDEFTAAIAKSEKSVELNLSSVDENNRKLAIAFARKFSDFDERQIEKIKTILKGGKKI